MLPDERYSMFGEINIIILEKWIHKKSSQIDKQKGHKKKSIDFSSNKNRPPT